MFKHLLLSPVLIFAHSYKGVKTTLSYTAQAVKEKGTDENSIVGVIHFEVLVVCGVLLSLLKYVLSVSAQTFLLIAAVSFVLYLFFFIYGQTKCEKNESIMEYDGEAMFIGMQGFTALLSFLFFVI